MKLISAAVHVALVALILLLGSAAHRIVKQRYQSTLVFSTQLPAPAVRLIHTASGQVVSAAPVKLAIGSPSTLHSATIEPQPVRLVALSVPAPLELPSSTLRVSEAPQVTVGVFSAVGSSSGHSQAATVSKTGFGSQLGVIGSGAARVVSAGFDRSPAPAAVPLVVRESTKPPVVTFEATPVYSEAGRAARISGTVVLRVRFTAEGTVKVLGVIQGLGYGLDESAIRTAESIRFTPASRDGQPVTFDTAARITFQLGGQ
jgi:TonB family protein